VTGRPGWDAIPAVRDGQVVEIKSAILLAPGPPPSAKACPPSGAASTASAEPAAAERPQARP
jgi:iron complex transport system substrate-binding protein